MRLIKLRRGDQYFIRFPAILNGAPFVTEDVEKVEFVMGGKRWIWPEDCAFDDGWFFLPVTQEESFALHAGDVLPVEGRVKFKDIDTWVKGADLDVYVRVVDASSRTVLGAEEI